jgi:formiminoglutamase
MPSNQQPYYFPAAKSDWQGRADSLENERLYQKISLLNLEEDSYDQLGRGDIAFLGFATDEGIRRNLGRLGAAQGPEILRRHLGNIPLNRIDIYEHPNFFDLGDWHVVSNDLEKSQTLVGDAIAEVIAHQAKPLLVGGGHEIAWANYLGLTKAKRTQNLGIINFDAHFDLRPLNAEKQSTSGTAFQQIALACQDSDQAFDYLCIGIQPAANTESLFKSAHDLRVKYWLAENIQFALSREKQYDLERFIDEHDYLYVTICLDVFANLIAPGVSAPQPLGLSPWPVIFLLRKILHSKKVISLDIAEFSPPHDINDMTSKLACSLIYEIIHHWS